MDIEKSPCFPEDCIQEILLRLPVKPLMRFKCVSKAWFSLISDPKFAKLHFELDVKPSHRLFGYCYPRFYSVDLDALFRDEPPRKKVFFLPLIESRGNILRYCRGFILFDNNREFIVWNPSTGAHKRVSYSYCLSSYVRYVYGFCYLPLKDDYLIVVVWDGCKYKEEHFEIFSFRTNSWTTIEVVLPTQHDLQDLSLEQKINSLLNGAIHWFARTDDNDSIFAFDLIERSFSSIPLPATTELLHPLDVIELGGYLTVVYSLDNYRTEMWMMKIYKDQSSWTRYELNEYCPIYLSRYRHELNEYCGKLIYLSKYGHIVQNSFGELMVYNNKGELLERSLPIEEGDFNYCYNNFTYVENILPLPGDYGLAAEDLSTIESLTAIATTSGSIGNRLSIVTRVRLRTSDPSYPACAAL